MQNKDVSLLEKFLKGWSVAQIYIHFYNYFYL